MKTDPEQCHATSHLRPDPILWDEGQVDQLLKDNARLQDQLDESLRERTELHKDRKRIDWLADRENTIGNVELPLAIVYENPHSLRDALDAAMALERKAGD